MTIVGTYPAAAKAAAEKDAAVMKAAMEAVIWVAAFEAASALADEWRSREGLC